MWALYAVRAVRRQLSGGALRPTVPRCWITGRSSALGTEAVLKRLSATCLEGALVRQEWLVAHNEAREVVIGVPPAGITHEPAHAWIDGLDTVSPERYVELYRIAPHLRSPSRE